MSRTSYIASTITIALLLFTMGFGGYFWLSAKDATADFMQGIKISLLLENDINLRQRNDIEQHLHADPDVTSFRYVSIQQATEEFEKSTGIVVDTIYGTNPIPASYEVTPSSLKTAGGVEDRAALQGGVSETYYPREIGEELLQKTDFIGDIILYSGILLLIITLLIMYTTLRLTIMNSTEEIRTMKLVGARSSFIKRPFIQRSVIQGFIGALIAIGLLLIFNELFAGAVGLQIEYGEKYWGEMAVIGSALCVVGVLICLIFTIIVLAFTVKRRAR